MVDATSARPFVATSTSRGTLVTLSGEFDLVTVREVAGQVDALLATAPSNVLMDMAALEFIDSSGIALLLKIYARVVTEGCGTLRVVNASDAARRTLELCGLTEAFGVDAAS